MAQSQSETPGTEQDQEPNITPKENRLSTFLRWVEDKGDDALDYLKQLPWEDIKKIFGLHPWIDRFLKKNK